MMGKNGRKKYKIIILSYNISQDTYVSLNRNKVKNSCKKNESCGKKKLKEAALNNKSNFLHTHNFFFFSISEQKCFMAFLYLFLSSVHVLFLMLSGLPLVVCSSGFNKEFSSVDGLKLV